MFGYADESGEPGVAKSDHDYFTFCIVLFKNREKAIEASMLIDEFRRKNRLSETHEFHYTTDSKKVRPQFIKLLEKLDFQFISVSIKKNSSRDTASYNKLANNVLTILAKHDICANISIDTNPLLYSQLKLQKKNCPAILHFSEKRSRGNNLIQIADYVTALRTRYVKFPNKNSAQNLYRQIEGKRLDSLDIS